MQSTSKIQVFLIIFILGLIAFIFFYGKNNPVLVLQEDDPEFSQTNYKQEQESFLVKEVLEQAEIDFELSASESYQQLKFSDADEAYLNLGHFWDSLEVKILSAYFLLLYADKYPEESTYYNAGIRYMEAKKIAKDQSIYEYAVENAMFALYQTLDYNPANLDARAELAICYINGKSQVMKGVGMLREITEANPEHQKALFYLGFLSMRSQQYEKAVERFKKLTEIQPEDPFNYYYLGQAYVELKEYENALEAFNAYSRYVKEPGMLEHAEQIIRQIKKNI